MALNPTAVDDIVNGTLRLYAGQRGRRWVDISTQYQNYIGMSALVNRKKLRVSGGDQISFPVQTTFTDNAANVGLFDVDSTNVDTTLQEGLVEWRFLKTSFGYDVREKAFNRSNAEIVNIILEREHQAMIAYAEQCETNIWTAPTADTDTTLPFGIPFWIQKSTTTPAGGFDGGNPSGFTGGRAGLSSTTYTRWKNWTFNYTTINESDAVTKLHKALHFTNFVTPDPYPELRNSGNGSPERTIYCVWNGFEELRRLAETRNDNLGSDVIKWGNGITVSGINTTWVPYLDTNDSDEPMYGVNWTQFAPWCQRGWDMYRHPAGVVADQPNARRVRWDTICNFVCTNLRTQFVGHRV